MSFHQQTWDSLRSKGFTISDIYVQSNVGPLGGRMYFVINDVAMSFDDARALDSSVVTLDEIARQRA